MQSTRRIALTATRTVGKSSHRTVGSVIAPKFVFQITQARLFRSSALAFSNVTQNSWAADRLTELGEALPAGEPIPPTQLSEEALYNPPEKILKLADELLACNMVESNQVWRIIQTRLGQTQDDLFSGAGGGGGGGGDAGAAEPEPVKEKEAFDLKLTEVPTASKLKIIKEVRAITGLGLKEAKEMVEGAPIVVKKGLKKDEADKLMKLIADAGGKAELL